MAHISLNHLRFDDRVSDVRALNHRLFGLPALKCLSQQIVHVIIEFFERDFAITILIKLLNCFRPKAFSFILFGGQTESISFKIAVNEALTKLFNC